jgi:chemotaxis protein CheX
MPKIDVRYINPALRAIVSVIRELAGSDPKAGEAKIKEDNIARGPITGILNMKGMHVVGSVAITFSEETALNLSRIILGMRAEKVNGELVDMTAELANMIGANTAGLLAEHGEAFEISLPTVIIGPDHIVCHKPHGPTLLIPFSMESGGFVVELCFENKSIS